MKKVGDMVKFPSERFNMTFGGNWGATEAGSGGKFSINYRCLNKGWLYFSTKPVSKSLSYMSIDECLA